MRRAGRFEKGAKLPLDFTHRIRYNKYRSKNDAPVCRNGRRGGLKIPCANNTCGFDPHHRHKKETPPACLGEFPFYLRRVSGSNSTALLCRASDQPCGLSLSARETPTTGTLLQLVWGSFLFYLRRVSGSNSTARTKKTPETPANVSGALFMYKTDRYAQPSSRLTMASIRSKHSSIWRTSVNWVRARSRLWLGRAVWK